MNFTKEQILKYSKKYDERYLGSNDELVERKMKGWLKDKTFLDKEGFVKIGLWKSKRPKKSYENNDEILVKEITGFSFSAIGEEARIKSLTVLNGVSWPVASTILHFKFPDRYPIMDFRAIWSLGWEQPKKYDFIFWQKYCEEITKLSKNYNLPMRTIDKALWEYSKENQK